MGQRLGLLLEEELAAVSTAVGRGYLPGAGTTVELEFRELSLRSEN